MRVEESVNVNTASVSTLCFHHSNRIITTQHSIVAIMCGPCSVCTRGRVFRCFCEAIAQCHWKKRQTYSGANSLTHSPKISLGKTWGSCERFQERLFSARLRKASWEQVHLACDRLPTLQQLEANRHSIKPPPERVGQQLGVSGFTSLGLRAPLNGVTTVLWSLQLTTLRFRINSPVCALFCNIFTVNDHYCVNPGTTVTLINDVQRKCTLLYYSQWYGCGKKSRKIDII